MDIEKQLQQLQEDYRDGLITQKGYLKKSQELLGQQNVQRQEEHRQEGPQIELQPPLQPRDLSCLNTVEKFDSLPLILRQRAKTYGRELALIAVVQKKETRSISWEKLYLKAEKVAQQIGKRGGLYKGDRVVLIYQDFEVIEFAVAFFGVLLAGMIAVPISNELSIGDIVKVMVKTQCKLCLTSDTVYKNFEELNSNSKIAWPKNVVFWKTRDMGTYQMSKKHDPPALNLPDLAYIEFSKYPVELKGVVLSHKTIMHQMSTLTRILQSSPLFVKSSLYRPESVYKARRESLLCTQDVRCSSGLVLGLLLTVYTGTLMVWSSTHSMEVPGFYANLITKYRSSVLISDTLGLKAAAFNYQSDPQATRKYDRKRPVDLSCVKWCLVTCLTVNSEVLEIIADRWLRPLGCEKAKDAVAPALALSEYGGMIVSVRDWLGKENKLGIKFRYEDDSVGGGNGNGNGTGTGTGTGGSSHSHGAGASSAASVTGTAASSVSVAASSSSAESADSPSEPPSGTLSEVLIEKDSLSTNTVTVSSDKPPSSSANFDAKLYSKYVRVGAFGFPLLDATVAVVDPETSLLSQPMRVGEIWIDSPCLSGGYWDLPEYTANIFHARCRDHYGHLDMEFLRTGLLGFVYNGKIYVLGLYEDRFRQRVTWLDQSASASAAAQAPAHSLSSHSAASQSSVTSQSQAQAQSQALVAANPVQVPIPVPVQVPVPVTAAIPSYRYHYSDHVSTTVYREVAKTECSAFDIFINNEYVPVLIIETPGAEKRPMTNSIDYEALDSLAVKAFEVLEKQHNVRLFCCGFVGRNKLPRSLKSGRTEIANMLCKTKFLQGSLKVAYVKFNIKKSLSNIPTGTDFINGIWSKFASETRHRTVGPSSIDRQYTGIDVRTESVDERSNARLSDFKTIVDVLKWRVMNQPDTLAFASVNAAKKMLSWKKFDEKIHMLCQHILNKTALRPGSYVVLMYGTCEEYVIALFACFITGIIPVPMAPVDLEHLDEDVKGFFKVVRDFEVRTVFVSPEVEQSVFKNKQVVRLLKLLFKQSRMPIVKSTAKLRSVKNMADLKSRITSSQAKFGYRDPKTTALVCLDWSPDSKRIGVRYTHQMMMNFCKILKETFRMGSFNSLLGGVRHVSGMGLIQTAILGTYLGCSTYLFSSSSQASLYASLANYKIRDSFVTVPMLVNAMTSQTMQTRRSAAKDANSGHTQPSAASQSSFVLSNLQNLMVGCSGRPNPELLAKYRNFMSAWHLPGNCINTTYTHRFSPLVTTRSYLNLDPVDLWLDPCALRQGLIVTVDKTFPNALHVQDSGVVLCCTQLAIVNPETQNICKTGELGEIWVYSEANSIGYVNGVHRQENEFLISQFEGKLDNFEFTYLRTGDLGFIHTVNKISIDGTPLDVQLLFVLGPIAETFESLGLQHFAFDIENTVEQCHKDLYENYSLCFKSDGYVVVICCAKRTDNLAMLVPIIFKSVLNTHQLMVDIVAFMSHKEFEHSRMFEKKRATMVHKWNMNLLSFVGVYGVNYGEESVMGTIREMESLQEEEE